MEQVGTRVGVGELLWDRDPPGTASQPSGHVDGMLGRKQGGLGDVGSDGGEWVGGSFRVLGFSLEMSKDW